MMERFEFIQNFVWINILAIVIMIFAPYFLRWFIIAFSDFLNIFLRIAKPSGLARNRHGGIDLPDHRMKIYRLLSVILFPGALIRITLIYGYLVLQGWTINTSYKADPNLTNNSMFSNNNKGGFFLYMSRGKLELTLRDAIILTLLCYIPLCLGILAILYNDGILSFINYIFNEDLQFRRISIRASIFNAVVYWWLVLCMLLGGAPVPEETSLILYYILATYPHLILGEILAFICGILISYMDVNGPYSADYLGMAFFYLMSLILFTKVLLDEKVYRLFVKSDFEFNTLLETISLF